MHCPSCGNQGAESARYCSHCGLALPSPAQQPPPPDAQASAPQGREERYKAIIGPNSRDYYLSYFSRCESQGKAGPSWHWPAFFVTVLWLIYRRMWLNALLYYALVYWLPATLLSLALKMPQAIGEDPANTAQADICRAFAITLIAAGWLLLPIYANALYYRHCREKISEAANSSPHTQQQLDALQAEGGVATLPLAVIAAPVTIAVAGIQATIALPPYEDHLARTNLAQAATLGTAAARAVADYYAQHQHMPPTLQEAQFTSALPPSITAIHIATPSGVITLTMAEPLQGKTLQYTPTLGSHNNLTWVCHSNEIENRHLPRECRHPHGRRQQ